MKIVIHTNHIALSAECESEIYQINWLSDQARKNEFEVTGCSAEAFWVCFYYPKQENKK